MDLCVIGTGMTFTEQPGRRYAPTGSGSYSLTTTYVGDVSDLDTFLGTKTKGTVELGSFVIEDVEIIYGLADDFTGDVTVVVHSVGQVAGYTSDTIISGSPASGSVQLWKVATNYLYDCQFMTVSHAVEVTQGSMPNGPAQEGTSGIGSVADPLIDTCRPVLMGKGETNEGLKGQLPTNPSTYFAEGTDYSVFNKFDGYAFRSFGEAGGNDFYRVTYYWSRWIAPIVP